MTVPATIEAVIKITEVCNIACTYCYMFYKGNDDYLQHPKYMSDEVIHEIAEFLRTGAEDLKARTVFVDLHGGEPLIIGRARFDRLCTILRSVIEPTANLEIRLQTNATLITHEWIPLFAKHHVGVGVSIDGDKATNDRYRIDQKGRGTYEKTRAGLDILMQAAKVGLISAPGLLCVADPTADGAAAYRHFVDDIGAKSIDFLLPMESHDSAVLSSTRSLAQYYRAIVEEWVNDDDPSIELRFLSRFINFLRRGPGSARIEEETYAQSVLITIASNGDVGPDDDLKPINVLQGVANIRTSSLVEYLSRPDIQRLNAEYFTLPAACQNCVWKTYCRGCGGTGRIINRFSSKNGFDNPSVFCADLQDGFASQLHLMLQWGYSAERAAAALGTITQEEQEAEQEAEQRF